MNARKEILIVSVGRPVGRWEEAVKHIAQRLLLAVLLAVVIMMPGLSYPASATADDMLDQSQPTSMRTRICPISS